MRGGGGHGRGGGGGRRGGSAGGGSGDPGFVKELEEISMHNMFCSCKKEEVKLDESKDEKAPLKPSDVFRVLRMITPFFWPRGEVALKIRMVASLLLILLSKLINLGIPFVMAIVINKLTFDITTIPVAMILL
jgi:hypothetical protein